MIDKSIIQATSSWPFVEARKLVKERQKIFEQRGKIIQNVGSFLKKIDIYLNLHNMQTNIIVAQHAISSLNRP